jgi:lipoprotein-releasing system permease protein
MAIESFVALRYLRPRRGRGLISVVTSIAVIGFAAGVAALILALAVTNGFRDVLQQELVGATAEINLLKRDGSAIANYRELMQRLAHVPHVVAMAPTFYTEGLVSHGQSAEVFLKGIDPAQELKVGELLQHVISGSWRPLATEPNAHNLVLGQDLAESINATVGDGVEVYVPNAVLTPLGYEGRQSTFKVVGIFASGFSDVDSRWALLSLASAQRLTVEESAGRSDRVTAIEFRLDDPYAADATARRIEEALGPAYAATTWSTQNKALFRALRLERLGTIIVIGLVVFVAAMNVLIMLTMLVMEKRREIAVLMSMGAKRRQVRRIFVLQGILIDVFGTAVGLAIGYGFAWTADRYRLIPLSAEVYPVSYVPFHSRALDGVMVALLALGVSYVATLYPSRRAVEVLPAETLRYE